MRFGRVDSLQTNAMLCVRRIENCDRVPVSYSHDATVDSLQRDNACRPSRIGRWLTLTGVTESDYEKKEDAESRASSHAMLPMTASANSFVLDVPPMSRVRTLPSAKTRSM